jgi:hypothetical protein
VLVVSDRAIRVFEFILRMRIRAIAFFPFIIIPSSTVVDDVLINHEKIHLRQQLELLVIPFYIWYLIEFFTKGYENISFEKEAYTNEDNLGFLKSRKMFNFRKYLK